MSDTPRTDSFAVQVGEPWIDFARQLERELAAEVKWRKAACGAYDRAMEDCVKMRERINELEAIQLTVEEWWITDANHDERKMRGPYKHIETANAVRREMENNASDERNEYWNLCVRCISRPPDAAPETLPKSHEI